MELGKAKYGSGKKVFKVQDGDNVYRILPPMGKLAKAGKWNMYYRVEWGYKNSAGKNRPFQDVRVVNRETKMVEVESAAHLRREALKEAKTKLVAELRKNPTDSTLKAKLNELNDAIKQYNLDSKYYMNAIDLNGQIGLLKIGHKAFMALKTEIDKLRKQGIDPLSVENGRFFNFNRSNATGNFQDTAYQVTPYKERVTVNGETYEKDKVHKIDDAIIARLSDEAYELSNMYPEVTAAQVEAMVKGGAAAVDQVLGAGDNRSADSEDDDGGSEEATTTTATATAAAPITKTEVVAAAATETKVEATTTVAPTKDLSDDEFLKSIGALR
jgi:hypothetical protein